MQANSNLSSRRRIKIPESVHEPMKAISQDAGKTTPSDVTHIIETPTQYSIKHA
jgi:hypothetical protein